tara:strand:- start:114 stop:344 length:231 start_codon:yes stop_codon:yes gene_type:complete
MNLSPTQKATINRIFQLIKKGNVNYIIIRNRSNDIVFKMPINFAVLCGLYAPVLAGLSIAMTTLKSYKIEIKYKSK